MDRWLHAMSDAVAAVVAVACLSAFVDYGAGGVVRETYGPVAAGRVSFGVVRAGVVLAAAAAGFAFWKTYHDEEPHPP